MHLHDLSSFDVHMLLIDDVCVGGAVRTVAAGIGDGGYKQGLGFRDGATGNMTMVKDLLEQRLPNECAHRRLAMLDGPKALAESHASNVRSTRSDLALPCTQGAERSGVSC